MGDEPGTSDSLRTMAGIGAVVVGLIVLLILALTAIGVLHDDGQAVIAVAASAFAVIGSVVGAYFGVREGTANTRQAIDAMREQALRAQALAAHIPADEAGVALERAQGMVRETFRPTGSDETAKRMQKRLEALEKEVRETRTLIDEFATEQRTQVMGKTKS